MHKIARRALLKVEHHSRATHASASYDLQAQPCLFTKAPIMQWQDYESLKTKGQSIEITLNIYSSLLSLVSLFAFASFSLYQSKRVDSTNLSLHSSPDGFFKHMSPAADDHMFQLNYGSHST